MNSIGNVLAGIVDKANAGFKPNDCDYVIGGLTYCGKCGEPKQKRLLLMGKEFMAGVPCKCEREIDKKRKGEEAKAKLALEIEKNIRESGLSIEQRGYSFSKTVTNKYNAKQVKYCMNYAAKFDKMFEKGQGLLLYGPPGTGKSFLADCIANELLSKGRRVKNVSSISLVGQFSFFGKEDYEDYVSGMIKPELLIVDDLGAERDTTYALERVHDLIDYRVNSGKPLIVTTNYSLEQMKSEPNIRKARTFDRIFGKCFPIPFTGMSFRKQNANKSYAEVKKMLEE